MMKLAGCKLAYGGSTPTNSGKVIVSIALISSRWTLSLLPPSSVIMLGYFAKGEADAAATTNTTKVEIKHASVDFWACLNIRKFLFSYSRRIVTLIDVTITVKGRDESCWKGFVYSRPSLLPVPGRGSDA